MFISHLPGGGGNKQGGVVIKTEVIFQVNFSGQATVPGINQQVCIKLVAGNAGSRQAINR